MTRWIERSWLPILPTRYSIRVRVRVCEIDVHVQFTCQAAWHACGGNSVRVISRTGQLMVIMQMKVAADPADEGQSISLS